VVFSSEISGGGEWGQRRKKDGPEENKSTNSILPLFFFPLILAGFAKF
jgi:hypothetical protein